MPAPIMAILGILWLGWGWDDGLVVLTLTLALLLMLVSRMVGVALCRLLSRSCAIRDMTSSRA